jgi:hypothetical protein
VAAATPSLLRVVMGAVARRQGESASELLDRAAACLPGAHADPIG